MVDFHFIMMGIYTKYMMKDTNVIYPLKNEIFLQLFIYSITTP